MGRDEAARKGGEADSLTVSASRFPLPASRFPLPA